MVHARVVKHHIGQRCAENTKQGFEELTGTLLGFIRLLHCALRLHHFVRRRAVLRSRLSAAPARKKDKSFRLPIIAAKHCG